MSRAGTPRTMASGSALRHTRRVTPAPDSPRSPLVGRVGARTLPGELGLRARATLAFGLVAAAVAAVGGLVVWSSVAGYLVTQRHEAAAMQALSNLEQVSVALRSQGSTAPEVLAQLPRRVASTSLLRTEQGEWFTDDLTVNRGAIPAELAARVLEGQPHSQRVDVTGLPALLVGLPVEGTGAAYFEIFLLDELDETLTTLSLALLAGGLALPLASMALAWWAVRPALRPLEWVADAASAIARGDHGARLDARGDPSLQVIAESFNSTADALERRVKLDAKFAADVSHELRSPLTTMVNTVGVMDRYRGSMADEGKEALDLLHAEVDGFQRLVQDLLVISRSEAGSDRLAMAEFRLAELVERALPAHLRSRLEVTPAGADALVRGDKRRLRQVLMNLVDNAERHGGGVSGVYVDTEGHEVCLTVEDSGPGLRDEELEGIFDRFSRGRGSERGATDGAGLGLALVAQQVRLLEGTVTAGNRARGGARFVVRLPRSGSVESSC